MTNANGVRTAAIILAVACSPSAFGQSIETILVAKQRFFVQPDAASVLPSSEGPQTLAPFDFTCSVSGLDMELLKPPPRVSGPFAELLNGGFLGFDPNQQDEWRYGAPDVATVADTQTSLDAQYPNGTYVVEALDAVVPLTIKGDLYPSSAPRMTMTGGRWMPDGSYLVRADDALTIATSAFPEFGSNVLDFILIEVFGDGSFFFAENFSWDTTSNAAHLEIRAGSLPGGRTLLIDALFISCAEVAVEIDGLPDAFGASFYGSGTRAILRVAQRADLDRDGLVTALDLATLLAAWGPCAGCDPDLNGDGSVDALDLAQLLSEWS